MSGGRRRPSDPAGGRGGAGAGGGGRTRRGGAREAGGGSAAAAGTGARHRHSARAPQRSGPARRGCEMAAEGSRRLLGLWLLAAATAGLCGGVAAGKSPSCHEVRTAFQLRQIGPLKLVPDVPTAGQYRPVRGVASRWRGLLRGSRCLPASPPSVPSEQRGSRGRRRPGVRPRCRRRGLRPCLRNASAPRLPPSSAGFPAGHR